MIKVIWDQGFKKIYKKKVKNKDFDVILLYDNTRNDFTPSAFSERLRYFTTLEGPTIYKEDGIDPVRKSFPNGVDKISISHGKGGVKATPFLTWFTFTVHRGSEWVIPITNRVIPRLGDCVTMVVAGFSLRIFCAN